MKKKYEAPVVMVEKTDVEAFMLTVSNSPAVSSASMEGRDRGDVTWDEEENLW